MSRRTTSVWTDAHAALLTGGAILSLLGALSVSGSFSGLEVALTTVAVALATFALASLADAFGGMLIGLAAGATLTAVHQYVPGARALPFATQAATLGLLFLLGMSTGLVADRMRRAHRIRMRPAPCIPDCRNVIDIDAQAQHGQAFSPRLPGLVAGMAASSGGRSSGA